MENPIQFTIVNAVPFNSGGAFWATKVEKRGESAITTKPQNIKKRINKPSFAQKEINGEIKQHKPDKSRNIDAVFLVPFFSDINATTTQENPPRPIIKKERIET